MCRWIAYRGETTSFEPYVTEPEHSLIAQSIRSLQSTAGSNGDGFGLGWYGEHPEPGLYRETRPAWSDENLRYLCRHLRSHLFFAHVRAATGTAVTRQNCHPFACGHGCSCTTVRRQLNRLRRKVEALIPDAYYPSRTGTTDSEAVFLAMMGAGLDSRSPRRNATVLRSLVGLVNEGELRERLRFTSAIANGRDLYAFRVAVNDAANTLYYPRGWRPGHRRVRAVRQGNGLDGSARKSRAGRTRVRKRENCSVRPCNFQWGRRGTGPCQEDYCPQVIPWPGGPVDICFGRFETAAARFLRGQAAPRHSLGRRTRQGGGIFVRYRGGVLPRRSPQPGGRDQTPNDLFESGELVHRRPGDAGDAAIAARGRHQRSRRCR